MPSQRSFIARPAALLAAAAVTGCAHDNGPPPQDLTVNDFRAPAAPAPAPQPATPPESTVVLDQSLGFSPARGPTGALEVVARPGPPVPPDAPARVAAPVDVEQKVGEINTRPVWASEFLGPMAARLRREAEQETPQKWRTDARERIVETLISRLEQELIRADTLASLPPAHRQGLSHIIEDTFRRERSAQFGSEALMERELRQQNSTLSDAWQTRRDELLIDTRRRQWRDQVHVSADEIELEYQRRYKDFKPRAVFRRISLPAANEEAAARIQQRLDAGDPFEEVARDPANQSNAANAGLVEGVGTFTGQYHEANFWARSATELNQAARSLSEGKWTGPFQTGSNTNWLYLERVEQEPISLLEAQPQIRRELEIRRFNEIANADFDRMKSRASYTDLDVMADRLLAIAERWYLEPVLARRAETGAPERSESRSRPRR